MLIYVGNLSAETLGTDLRREFEAFGKVTRAAIVVDHETHTSAGYGFVKMASKEETEAALRGLTRKQPNGQQWQLRPTRRVAAKESLEREPL